MLERIPKYYQGFTHQDNAIAWLENRLKANGYGSVSILNLGEQKAIDLWSKLSEETKNEFTDRWRNDNRQLTVGDTDRELVYYNQLDNSVLPYTTCNSSSNAMLLKYMIPSALGTGAFADDPYVKRIVAGEFGYKGYKNPSIYHDAQTRALKAYGLTTEWRSDAIWHNVEDQINKHIPTVVNINHKGTLNHPHGGHIILLTELVNGALTIYDPYGMLSWAMGTYNTNSMGIYKIDMGNFKTRWQGGYRIVLTK